MNSLAIAIVYALSGFLMKFSDDEYDENSAKVRSSTLAMISGFLIGYLASVNIDASYIFLTILIASAISLKIDGIHHIVSLIAFIITCFVFDFFTNNLLNLSLITLTICILSGYLDEIGNDNPKFYRNRFLSFFFEYRLTMPITVLIFALFGLYSNLTGFNLPYVHFLSLSTFVCFLLFDLGYILAGTVFKRYFVK